MNMFENYYGKPQGNVNLYGFNFPIQWYNTIWFEGDSKHAQPLIQTCNGQEVVPKSNALDLVDKLYRVYTTLIISENLRLGIEDKLNKYEVNQDKKNELILTNNDVIKNNQEMEKLNNEREDRILEKIDKAKENYKEEYKELLEIIKDSKDEKYINKMKEVCNDMKLVLKYIDKENPIYEYIIEKYDL